MEIICYACGKGEYPENTIEAIQNCQNVNKNWRIEMDLQLTSDNKIILFHDDNLKRVTDLNIEVKDISLKYIKELNAGYHFKEGGEFKYRNNPIIIPTLIEVFYKFPKAKFLLDIRTKNIKIVDKLINLILKHNIENQVVIVSKHHYIKTAFQNQKPNWQYGASTKDIKKLVLSSLFYLENLVNLKANILMIPKYHNKRTILTSNILNYAKNKNKKLWLWLYEGKEVITIDSINLLNKFKNVDAIFTSFPNRLNINK